MIKLKDILWGEIDFTDEGLTSENPFDAELNDEVEGRIGGTIMMCCSYTTDPLNPICH